MKKSKFNDLFIRPVKKIISKFNDLFIRPIKMITSNYWNYKMKKFAIKI